MTSQQPTSNPTQAQLPNEQPAQDLTYDVIPKLGPARPGDTVPSLLPKIGGWPGYEYAQIPCARAREFETKGWFSIFGASRYTITGPEGSIDCELVLRGNRIHGLDPDSSKRCCWVHKDIIAATGLSTDLLTTDKENPPHGQQRQVHVQASKPAQPAQDQASKEHTRDTPSEKRQEVSKPKSPSDSHAK